MDDRRHGKCCLLELYIDVLVPEYVPSVFFLSDSSAGAIFLPFAISTRDLRQRVIEALEQRHPEGLEVAGIKVPTLTWFEVQISPGHTGYKADLRHTGMQCLCNLFW